MIEMFIVLACVCVAYIAFKSACRLLEATFYHAMNRDWFLALCTFGGAVSSLIVLTLILWPTFGHMFDTETIITIERMIVAPDRSI